jgi:tetratricopeptide (TPR) repeat protein
MAKAVQRGSGSGAWIYRPSLDLLVGCGAWSAPLLLLAYPFTGSSALVLGGGFYALALLFNYPHYMATIYRAYHTREDFEKYKIFTIHITGLLLTTALLAHGFPRLLPWIYTLYLTWSPWHYMGQNFGLSMMFARRNGAHPSPRDRNLLYAAFIASYAMVFLSMHARPSGDSYVLSLGLPAIMGRVLRTILAPAFLVLAGWAIRNIMRTGEKEVPWRMMLPSIVLLSTEFLWFVLPSILELGWGFRIPQQRYADGVLALMHSAQYLWITSYYARREAQAAHSNWNGWAYFGVLVAGGIALFVPGPWFFSRIVGLDFTASFLTFTAIINIHHFILDGQVWKLRDNRVASMLLDAKGPAAAPAQSATGKLADALDWLRSPAPAARRFRRAAVVALVALALVDQAKYLFTLRPSLTSLTIATWLNPNDSSIWLDRAQAEAAQGRVSETIASLKRAVAVNPHRRDAQKALAMYYLQNQIFDKAREQYQEMGRYTTLDAASWLNYGLLEWQRKNPQKAVEYWRNCEALDPSNKEVHLYLAGVFDELNQNEDAIHQYERYIVLLAKGPPLGAAERKSLALTSMKLGAAFQRTAQPEQARYYFESAAKFAQQVPDTVIESLARFRLAETLAELNRRSDALRNFQTVLQLDAKSKDDPTVGADWYSYAGFLQSIEAPDGYVLACYLKSEELLGEKAETKAREELEKKMGHEAAVVRKNWESIAQEATKYRR